MAEKDNWDKAKRAAEILAAIAVVTATTLAFVEFVIKDRERSRQVSANTLRLIELDLNDRLVESRGDFVTLAYSRGLDLEAGFSPEDAIEVYRILMPQIRYFAAWETCIAAALCNEEVGHAYICTRVDAFMHVFSAAASSLGAQSSPVNQKVIELHERCVESRRP